MKSIFAVLAFRATSTSNVHSFRCLPSRLHTISLKAFVAVPSRWQDQSLASASDFASKIRSPSPAMSTQAADEGATDQEENIDKIPYPLIDVDSNLLHKDLVALGRYGVVGAPPEESNSEDDDHQVFDILKHPSTEDANIRAVFSPSSTLDESRRSVQLFSKYMHETKNNKAVRAKTSVGIHPYHTHPDETPAPREGQIMNQLRELIQQGTPDVVSCVGECGLDYSPSFPAKEHQIPWFEAQLDLALELKLPIFVHERLAFQDTLKCIDEAVARASGENAPKIIVHCFTGTTEECAEYVKRGYSIGLTGFLRKENVDGAQEIRTILQDNTIPLDKLMIETDAPYLGFQGCRDSYLKYEGEALSGLKSKQRKRQIKSISPNVPSALPLVLAAVTNALNDGRLQRGEDLLTKEVVAKHTTQNAIEFFGFSAIP
jgi:TatD DNase family protein